MSNDYVLVLSQDQQATELILLFSTSLQVITSKVKP